MKKMTKILGATLVAVIVFGVSSTVFAGPRTISHSGSCTTYYTSTQHAELRGSTGYNWLARMTWSAPNDPYSRALNMTTGSEFSVSLQNPTSAAYPSNKVGYNFSSFTGLLKVKIRVYANGPKAYVEGDWTAF